MIGWLAAEGMGVFTRRELIAAGVSGSSIDRRLADGRLITLHKGIYRARGGGDPLSPYAAALLACGKGAVLSHRTAAALWEILPSWPGPIHVNVPGRRRHAGIVAHRCGLEADEVTRVRGLPATSPLRTLQDLARSRIGDDDLERAVSQAHVRRLVTPELLQRHAIGRLRALVEEMPGFHRSEAERMLRRLLRDAVLPTPGFNRRILGFEVDAVWEAERLVLEFDGYSAHAARRNFEEDRRRTLALQNAGWTVVRISWRQLTRQPLLVVASIGRHLGGELTGRSAGT